MTSSQNQSRFLGFPEASMTPGRASMLFSSCFCFSFSFSFFSVVFWILKQVPIYFSCLGERFNSVLLCGSRSVLQTIKRLSNLSSAQR